MENKELNELLSYKKKSAWLGKYNPIMSYAEGYKAFLAQSKTERECSDKLIELARSHGFSCLKQKIAENAAVKAGDKLYYQYHGKALVLFVVGEEPLEAGLNITAAHIDSPRLDLKSVPLYEDNSLALMKTHYYGGIKKYQWGALPLSMHGVIYSKDGTKQTIAIGEDDNDPVFFISDLLVHLAGDQMGKNAANVLSGEQLNIICASIPVDDPDVSSKVKFNVLKMLNEKYGIDENSFLTAEIEIVPAGKPRDVGFDRGMISAYGNDDRVCAYPAATALFELEKPVRTCACILADKEEIGSVGTTGMKSKFFENAVAELYNLKEERYCELGMRRALANSSVLSMDVTCAYDPNFPEAFEKNNTVIAGSGAGFCKYTGARGKSGSNDAHSEYFHELTEAFERADVVYQTGELGKVDGGGGGTVALILAEYGANTIDYGVGVISMHAPYELISKADLYSCYEGAKVFYAM